MQAFTGHLGLATLEGIAGHNSLDEVGQHVASRPAPDGDGDHARPRRKATNTAADARQSGRAPETGHLETGTSCFLSEEAHGRGELSGHRIPMERIRHAFMMGGGCDDVLLVLAGVTGFGRRATATPLELTIFREVAADTRMLIDAYLQHLTDHDLQLLAGGRISEGTDPRGAIRGRPALLDTLLADRGVFEDVFRPDDDAALLQPVSPFLVFAVAVARTMGELTSAGSFPEWFRPRQRVVALDPGPVRDFLADGWRRLFLAELLASYSHVSSGSVLVHTRRGWRRQRFSELDPVRLASLLDVVAEIERPGVYRRLGDLALFLTGVFPDHTALHGFSTIAEARLMRAGRIDPRRSLERGGPAAFSDDAVALLEELGRRWYRLAYLGIPEPKPVGVAILAELSERFGQARRILNVMTDRLLFGVRDRWFGFGTSGS